MSPLAISIIGIAIIVIVAALAIVFFMKKSKAEKIEQIKGWLLYAVTEAEKELGSGTGKVKLAYVYNLFLTKFPAVAKIIPYATFSLIVDEVLDKFKDMLKTNTNLQVYVEGTESNTEEEEA